MRTSSKGVLSGNRLVRMCHRMACIFTTGITRIGLQFQYGYTFFFGGGVGARQLMVSRDLKMGIFMVKQVNSF